MEYIRDTSRFAQSLVKYVFEYFRIDTSILDNLREDLYQEIDIELLKAGVYGKQVQATEETIRKIIRAVRIATYRTLKAYGYVVKDNKYFYNIYVSGLFEDSESLN